MSSIGNKISIEGAPQSSMGERDSRLLAGLSAAAAAFGKFYPEGSREVLTDTHILPRPAAENTVPLNPVQHTALHGTVEAPEA